MTFTAFTTNGWIDSTHKYVIVANPDVKTFETRYYENGYSLSDALLNKEQRYIVIGKDLTDDNDAIKAAESHMNPIQEIKSGDSQSKAMTKMEKLMCDIAHMILDALEK